MPTIQNRPRLAIAAILATVAVSAVAVLVSNVHTTQSQPRTLDVPYVPTPEHIVDAMLRLAQPATDDFLVDLGCGDGRIPIAAAQKFGIRGLGVDLNPTRITEARANATKAGVSDKVQFIEGDLFKTDFKQASVLTLYLLPIVNMRLRPQILGMKPGTRVVSHAFHMEDWTADATEQHDFRTIYAWVVPAKVAGNWTGTTGDARVELSLEQKFQVLTGTATVDNTTSPIANGRVNGTQISFELVMADGEQRRFSGRLAADGRTIDIEAQGSRMRWRVDKR